MIDWHVPFDMLMHIGDVQRQFMRLLAINSAYGLSGRSMMAGREELSVGADP